MTLGTLVEIKHFAVHDGPGIRTTVFLKGCPLHCRWCHNPEGIRPEPELAVLYSRCTGCGRCAAVCPCHKIENGEHRFDLGSCRHCGKCANACLHDALILYGYSASVETVARDVLSDRPFYRHGGGVTISGGEPLLQPEFCTDLLSQLQTEKIHCAIDTSGEAPWDILEQLLSVTDLFLYDLKHIDHEKHQKYTGRGNRRILENLKRLSLTGKEIEIRIPVIPGFNDSDDEIAASGDFLAGLRNISGVRLLPYHSLARSKYLSLGRKDTMPQATSPDSTRLRHIADILRRRGLRVLS